MHRLGARLALHSALLPLLPLGACQTYEPKPLDLAAHDASWTARLDSPIDLPAFARELDDPSGSATLDLADGIDLPEAELVALAFNPRLRQARARLQVSAAREATAGLWDDPEFAIDVLRIVESVPNPWVIPMAVSFTIPLSGRLDVEKALAANEHRAALRQVMVDEWQTVAALRRAWLAWSAALVQAELSREILERIETTMAVVDQLERVGQMSRIEARLFRLEQASRRADRLRLEAAAAARELEVRALMGIKPRAPAQLHPSLRLLEQAPEIADAESLAAASPLLTVRRAEYQVAEEALHLEIRRQYPDLTIGPAFERDQDQSRVGFVLGIPIPILNANRGPIAEATALREAARVAFESEYEQLVAAIEEAALQLRAAREARALVEEALVPLAEAQLADQARLVQLGQVSTLVALETVIRGQETKVRLVDARLAESKALADLLALVGPPTARRPGDAQPDAPASSIARPTPPNHSSS